MITAERAQAMAQEWIEAWNSHDLERILSHYAEEVEFFSPLIEKLAGDPSGRLQGKKKLEEYFKKGLAAYPHLRFDYIECFAGADSVAILYRSVNNSLAAETMTLDAQGKIVRAMAHYSPRHPKPAQPTPAPQSHE